MFTFVMFESVQRKQIDAIAQYLINIFIFPFFCVWARVFCVFFCALHIHFFCLQFYCNYLSEWTPFSHFDCNNRRFWNLWRERISNKEHCKAWTITKNLVAMRFFLFLNMAPSLFLYLCVIFCRFVRFWHAANYDYRPRKKITWR